MYKGFRPLPSSHGRRGFPYGFNAIHREGSVFVVRRSLQGILDGPRHGATLSIGSRENVGRGRVMRFF